MQVQQVQQLLPLLSIEGQGGKPIRFTKPHEEQREVLATVLKHRKTLEAKCRQIGLSTVITAYIFCRLLLAPYGLQATLVAHESDAAERLLRFLRYYWESLPEPLRPPLALSNRREMVFKRTGATARVLTAGGRSSGRSTTNQILFLDEVAYWPSQAQEVMGSLLATVDDDPDSRVIVCSTPNGPGDAFHGLVQNAQGNPEWRVCFHPWWRHARYRTEPPAGWVPTEQRVIEAVQAHGLTPAQAYWMSRTLQDLGWERFLREYPPTLEAGFIGGEGLFFDLEALAQLTVQLHPTTEVERQYHMRQAGDAYVLGVDPAGGTGNDDSAIVVLNQRYEVCYVYASNRVRPTEFGDRVADVAQRYGRAKVLVESNNHGLLVLERLKQLGYGNLWKHQGKDWTTTNKSKLDVFEHARNRMPFIVSSLHDLQLVEQLLLIREEGGCVYHPLGSHDDIACAFVFALWAARDLPTSAPTRLPPGFIRPTGIF